MNKIQALAELGQSIWIDYIRRSFITSGSLQKWIDQGLTGMTSNPSIFEKAIAQSDDYTEDLRKLAQSGSTDEEIYYRLVIDDIRLAADTFRPVYDRTGGEDGYVSVEVDPTLANDTQATIEEAKHLWNLVDRPNLMVKIPATREGIPAIREATAEGVNVNITLIFSNERYKEVMEAYLSGLEKRIEQGKPVDRIHSVASFFVSRVDTKVDKRLEEIIKGEGPQAEKAAALRGKAAVANAKQAYQFFQDVFMKNRFERIHQAGGNLQRPLWASTSTKNPAYSDIKYVQELIGAHTVNTVPEETLEKFLDHGEVYPTVEDDLAQAERDLRDLADLGISMEQVTQELEDEGVAAFAKSFDELFDSIAKKRLEFTRQTDGHKHPARPPVSVSLSTSGRPSVEELRQALASAEQNHVNERIWQGDHAVWKDDPNEISNRLGWLHTPGDMRGKVREIEDFVASVQADGYRQAAVLGMGGSSLAPDLFSRTFPDANGLQVHVIDSTDPEVVLRYTESLNPLETLFIVSSKSGTTEESLSFFRYFYNWTAETLGAGNAGKHFGAGEHFAAITDPGSKLLDLARQYGFRKVFVNDPNIGGRYSALSDFGIVPAALAGVHVPRLLNRAAHMARRCGMYSPPASNPGFVLGTILGEAAKSGRDKATFVISPAIAAFGDWVEQLIAESTGKEGKGILPVVGEPLGPPAVYGNDRLFISIQLKGDETGLVGLQNLQDSGFPVVRFELASPYDLGGQFFLWEFAIAVAGYRMGINPFDQPNVESAKKRAREMVAAYQQSGNLPQETPLLSRDGIEVFAPSRILGNGTEWNLSADTQPGTALAEFLTQAHAGDYIAIQAFVPPTPETDHALLNLRTALRDQYHLATTVGYGPRFLHSTGQLHKGDAGNGLFVQITSQGSRDAAIPAEAGKPESAISFGVLKLAQAMGDRAALKDAGRRLIHFHITSSVPNAIAELGDALHSTS